MDDRFTYNVFLSHSVKDKPVVRPLAERLRQDGLKVWFDEWALKPGDSIPAKIDPPSLRSYGGTGEGLEHSQFGFRISHFGFAQPGTSANALGSDRAQLASPSIGSQRRRKAGTFRVRDPLNQERRFIALRLDDARIKGSLARFLYINRLPPEREQEYAKLGESDQRTNMTLSRHTKHERTSTVC
jgi:hypothetical protein